MNKFSKVVSVALLMASDLDASGTSDGTDALTIMQYIADSNANSVPTNPYA